MPHANGGSGLAPVREADGCRILHRLEVREGPTGEGDADAPFVAAIVPEVDIQAGTVTVTPPLGLFEEVPEESDDETEPDAAQEAAGDPGQD